MDGDWVHLHEFQLELLVVLWILHEGVVVVDVVVDVVGLGVVVGVVVGVSVTLNILSKGNLTFNRMTFHVSKITPNDVKEQSPGAVDLFEFIHILFGVGFESWFRRRCLPCRDDLRARTPDRARNAKERDRHALWRRWCRRLQRPKPLLPLR